MQLNDDAKNTILQALANFINANASAKLVIYIDMAVAAEIALPNPAQLNIATGIMVFNALPTVIATADGVPTSCEIQDDLGVVIAQLPASAIQLDKPQVYIGGNVSVLSLMIRI